MSFRHRESSLPCKRLFWCQRADKVNQIPAIGIREGCLEGRHARARKAIGNPFEQLCVGMDTGNGMLSQIGRSRIEHDAERSIPLSRLTMTWRAIGCKQSLTRCNGFTVRRNRIRQYILNRYWMSQVKNAQSQYQQSQRDAKTQPPSWMCFCICRQRNE